MTAWHATREPERIRLHCLEPEPLLVLIEYLPVPRRAIVTFVADEATAARLPVDVELLAFAGADAFRAWGDALLGTTDGWFRSRPIAQLKVELIPSLDRHLLERRL